MVGKCAVVMTSTADLWAERKGAGWGFAWIECQGLRIYSCYNSRSDSSDLSEEFLRDLEHSIRSVDQSTLVVLGGDFNAWSTEWGLLPTTQETISKLILQSVLTFISATSAELRPTVAIMPNQ